MPKIHKTYPSFYNGVSEQPPELMLDNQCKDMVNCMPSLINGLHKRPPVNFVKAQNIADGNRVFHTYDRGDGVEQYIFVKESNYNSPIHIYDKAGNPMTVTFESGNETALKDYLAIGGRNFKGLTVQDRTWLVNKDASVTVDTSSTTAPDVHYDKVAFYWLKRGSGDRYNPYNYAVYLNGVTYACNPNKPSSSTTDPSTGFEDSDYAASYLRGLINGSNGFVCEVNGSILKIYKSDNSAFTFSSWDSWGNQASEGWKGKVNRITDLPKDFFWEDTYIEITGDNQDNFTNYYVKWNGSSWEETVDPSENRGILSNMPIAIDRVSEDTFEIKLLEWSQPRVGNTDNNPDPSFVGNPITDLFFYRNRFGIASTDSVVMSEAANYVNFFVKTAIDVLDNDPIDVAVASSKASKVYFVKPFNSSLYIFTKNTQYELTHEGYLSPNTVSIDVVTNYPMAINVEPVVVNNSLFFISTTAQKQQLREFIRTEKLAVEGVDLNVATPNYLDKPIVKLVANGTLGIVLCCTANNEAFIYCYKDDGNTRIQSGWSRWVFLEGFDYSADSFEFDILDATLLVICKTGTDYRYHTLNLEDVYSNNKIDTTRYSVTYPLNAKVQLPDYYPHMSEIGSPKDKVLLKKVTIEGTGSFDADLYRKDYDKTYTKSSTLGLRDLDLHISSKVGNVDIFIKDSSINDFKITSVIVEGLFSPTSKEMK